MSPAGSVAGVVQRVLTALPRGGNAFALADQVASSVSNFVVAAIIARATGPSGYAGFALAMTVWFLVLGVSRSLVVDPTILSASRLSGADAVTQMRRGYFSGLVLSAIVGSTTALIGVGFWLGDRPLVARPILAFAVALPLLLIQDNTRWQSLGLRNGRPALANDVVFAVVEIAVAAGLFAVGRLTTVTGLLSIAVGARVADLYGIRQYQLTRVPPNWRRHAFSMSTTPIWLLVDFAGQWVAGPALLILVAFQLGTHDTGIFRAMQDVFAPLRLLQLSLTAVLVPAGAAVFAVSGPAPLKGLVRRGQVALFGVSGLYAVAVGLLGPTLLRHTYGPQFAVSGRWLFVMALSFVLLAVQLPAAVAMKAAQRMRLLAATRVHLTIPTVIGFLVATWLFGLRGAIAAPTVLFVWTVWLIQRRAARALQTTPASAVTASYPVVPAPSAPNAERVGLITPGN